MYPRLLLWAKIITILLTLSCAAIALVLSTFQLSVEAKYPDVDSYAIVVICVTSLYLLSLLIIFIIEAVHRTHPSPLICQIVFELPWILVISILFLGACAIPTYVAQASRQADCARLAQHRVKGSPEDVDYSFMCPGSTAVLALCFLIFGLLWSYSLLLVIIVLHKRRRGDRTIWRYSVRELSDAAAVPVHALNSAGGQTHYNAGSVQLSLPQMHIHQYSKRGPITQLPPSSYRAPRRGRTVYRPDGVNSYGSDIDSGIIIPSIYVIPPSNAHEAYIMRSTIDREG